MNETKVVALTAELRAGGNRSCQQRMALDDWQVTAHSSAQVAASVIVDIAARHGITAMTNRAEFRGTLEKVTEVEAELRASKISTIADYVGDGNTDEWVVRAVSASYHDVSAVMGIATRHGVAATTDQANFR